jgi:hypothetical protein
MVLITFLTNPSPTEKLTRVAVTGHMVDREDRLSPRFPAAQVGAVQETLAACLDTLARERGALRVITSGTQGIDLLAIDLCLERGWPADMYLAQDEQSFLPRSVGYGAEGPTWLTLYERAKRSGLVGVHIPMSASDPSQPFRAPAQGTTQHRVDLNEHMVALLRPQDLLVAYWDGKGGDKPGGTEHMVRTALDKGIECLALNAHLVGAQERPELLRYWRSS